MNPRVPLPVEMDLSVENPPIDGRWHINRADGNGGTDFFVIFSTFPLLSAPFLVQALLWAMPGQYMLAAVWQRVEWKRQ